MPTRASRSASFPRAGGDLLKAQSVAWTAGQLKIGMLGGAPLVVPAEQVLSLDFSSGKGPLPVPARAAGSEIHARSSIRSGPIAAIVRGTAARCGWETRSTPAACGFIPARLLKYRLNGDYRRFQAVMGIDQAVAPLGNVHVVISGDGKTLVGVGRPRVRSAAEPGPGCRRRARSRNPRRFRRRSGHRRPSGPGRRQGHQIAAASPAHRIDRKRSHRRIMLRTIGTLLLGSLRPAGGRQSPRPTGSIPPSAMPSEPASRRSRSWPPRSSPSFSGRRRPAGRACLITHDGYALTNFHVAGEDQFFKCGLSDGKLYDAVLVGVDPTGDVALIKLVGRDDFPTATWGDSDAVRAGRLGLRPRKSVSAGLRLSADGDLRHRERRPPLSISGEHDPRIHRLPAGRRVGQSGQLGGAALQRGPAS